MPAECNWSNNNLACLNTWGFLRALKQLNAVFGPAGALKMPQLTFWNPAASPDARRAEAMALAAQLDNMFIKALRAKYETGYTSTKAITQMADKFVDKESTVCHLAATVDDAYRFTGEKM